MMSLLEMSVCGGILILAVLAARRVSMDRLPKAALRLLWAVALCRLLLPLRIPSPASVYSAVDRIGEAAGRPGLLLNGEQAARAVPAQGGSLLWAVWAAGAVLLAAFFLVCHLRGRRKYRESLPLEHPFVKGWLESHRLRRPVQARVSDQIGSPLTYGVLWPVILLPRSLDWEDERGLAFILAHETAHIRRFDALAKWLLAAALCLHWFNPLVWAMYLLANRDLELSCDEAVVREYGRQVRESYALTLVGMEERRCVFAPLESGFSKNALKERITSILRSPRITGLSVAAAVTLTAAVAVCFATSAPRAALPAAGTEVRDTARTAEAVQETVVHGGYSVGSEEIAGVVAGTGWLGQGTGYTQAQYDQLMKALYAEDYETMSIAAFNSKVNEVLGKDDGRMMEVYEMVSGFLPDNDPKAGFLRNTVQASLTEYYARLEEAYSDGRNDPEFWGEAEAVQKKDVFGKSVETRLLAQYSFTYRILDQKGLTVGERDEFLQRVMQAAQDSLKEQAEQGGGEEEFRKALESSAAEASGEKIEFTGCRVDSVEID